MKKITSLLLLILLTACTSYDIRQSMPLKNLSEIPAPRTGGPVIYPEYSISENEQNTLINSGYFSKVELFRPDNPKGTAHIEIYSKNYDAGWKTVSGALSNVFLSILTLGIFPVITDFEESWDVRIKTVDNKAITGYLYKIKGKKYKSYLPIPMLFGAHESRMQKHKAAIFTNNLIYDLNQKGLLNQ